METVRQFLPLLLQISLALIVAAVGLQARWRDLARLLSTPARLMRAVLAVNVVVPVVAILMTMILPIAPAVKAGIIVMAVSPLAPFAPGKMIKSGADASGVVGLYFALIALAVVLVPATLELLSRIFPADASLPVGSIARFLFISVFLPLAAGLAIASILPGSAQRIAHAADLAGKLLLLPIVILLLYKAGGPMLSLIGDGTVIAIVVIVAAALVAGHFLGGPEPDQALALATAAATRHPGIAALIAHRNFDDPRVIPAILLFLFTSMFVSAIYMALRRRRQAAAPVDPVGSRQERPR